MPDLEVRPGLMLNYRASGPEGAPALLLITGLGGLQEGWFRQVPYFERHYRVISFDNRGAGRSGLLDVPTTMLDLAEDTIALLDGLGVARAHVWGVSMGGKVAMEIALGWPDRIDRLVLENTTAGEAHRVEGPVPSLLRAVLEPLTEEDWLERIVPLLFGRAYRERNAVSMKAFARSRVRHPQDPTGIRRQFEAYDAFDAWDRLPDIPHRTLVLVGEEDGLTDPENGRLLAERLPDATLHLVRGAGHSLHIEAPDEVNAEVERFLGQ